MAVACAHWSTGQQVAVMRVGEEVFALENRDPFSGANVIARGLVGDLAGQLVVASPVYKQHFNLRTGRCLEDESVSLRTWPCGVLDGRIWVESLQKSAAAGAPRPSPAGDRRQWHGRDAYRRGTAGARCRRV